MKFVTLLFLLLFLAPISMIASGEESGAAKPWNDIIESDLGKFAVSVKPAQKKVEVKKVSGNQNSPPHLRVRILRPNDRPLEFRLKTVERVNSPLYYTGSAKTWNDSYAGIEVDFSFDKKTWKRLGRAVRKVVP